MRNSKNLTPQLVSYSYQENPIKFNIGSKVMVNATNMAKPFGKRPVDWLRFNQSQEFINALSKVRNHTLADLVQVTKGGINSGTWFHEDVAIEFARWLSPEFGIWCNDRIKEILLNSYNCHYNTDNTFSECDKKEIATLRFIVNTLKTNRDYWIDKYKWMLDLYNDELEKNLSVKESIKRLL